MARKFLTAIDLAKNELQNGVVQNLASAPGSPVKGQIYFDSTTNTLYWYNGSAWVPAMGGATSYGTITAEQSFGASKTDGVSANVARADHAHGNPTHVDADHAAIHLNALAVPTADVSWGNFKITSLGAPAFGTDAANKAYVDNAIAGLVWKNSVVAATTANITLSALQTIDGVAVVSSDRVLVKNQSSSQNNGIYAVQVGAWSRVTDADSAAELLNSAVFVERGTTNADTAWVCTTDAPITLGTTSLTYAQFAGGGTVTAGAGMTQSGNVLNVIGDSTVTVAADSLGVANSGVTNAKLANMNALTIKGNNTGSAAAPLDLTTALVKGMLGLPTDVAGIHAQDVGGATSVVVNHNLNSRDVTVNIYRVATPWDTVETDVERTDVNNVTVRFAVAPAAAEFRCVVVG